MNEKMNVEELLDELYDMVEKAWNFPLSRGRAMLDVEEVKEILEEIRDAMPQEIRQAKAIVADRTQIISDAKRVAEERARAMVNQDEIVKQAQQKANEMLAQAQTRFRKMQKACNVYIDDLMQRTDEGLTANLAELRKTRQEIKASLRSGQQNQN